MPYSYHRCNYFIFFLCNMAVFSCNALSFDSIYAFFGIYAYQVIYDKEYHVENPGTLSITNKNGNITIKTTWKQNTIRLKAILETSDEHAKKVTIQEHLSKQHNKTNVTLQSTSDIKGRINYELIIPATIDLQLTTEYGSIVVNEAQDYALNGTIMVTTLDGSIEIYNCVHAITAQTKNGSITIKHAKNMNVRTQTGDITMIDTTGSIIAHTDKGDIATTCTAVPNLCRVELSTLHGTIELALPATTNATIQGKTEHGIVLSEHYITLKPQTTKLNTLAWQRFKKELYGTIGSGEADIILSNEHGNIKILEMI